MELFRKHEPVLVKSGSSSRMQLAQLEALRGTLTPQGEKTLEADIRAVRAGILGEDRVLFELMNSHMDLFILQDLFLVRNGLAAQIDFLVLTRQRYFVIECKNLYGDIEVDNRGNFTRAFGGRRKEGIYSPITQNQRHLDLIHAILMEERGTFTNMLVDGDFSDQYRSLVVLANPKTVLKDRYAKREVKEKIIRADQLIATIKTINDEPGPGRTKARMSWVQQSAEKFLARHVDTPRDFTAKYANMRAAEQPDESGASQLPRQTMLCPACGAPLVLRTARKGPRTGKRFYGCSTYPQCRGIVNIDE